MAGVQRKFEKKKYRYISICIDIHQKISMRIDMKKNRYLTIGRRWVRTGAREVSERTDDVLLFVHSLIEQNELKTVYDNSNYNRNHQNQKPECKPLFNGSLISA